MSKSFHIDWNTYKPDSASVNDPRIYIRDSPTAVPSQIYCIHRLEGGGCEYKSFATIDDRDAWLKDHPKDTLTTPVVHIPGPRPEYEKSIFSHVQDFACALVWFFCMGGWKDYVRR